MNAGCQVKPVSFHGSTASRAGHIGANALTAHWEERSLLLLVCGDCGAGHSLAVYAKCGFAFSTRILSKGIDSAIA